MTLNKVSFAEHLRNNALPKSAGKCAKYVREAREAGGGLTKGPSLPRNGGRHCAEWGSTS